MRNFFVVLCFSVLTFRSGVARDLKTVIFIPFDQGDQSDRIFAPYPDNYWCELKEACERAGYRLTTRRNEYVENVYAVVTFNAVSPALLSPYATVRKILYTWEPPVILPANFEPRVHLLYDTVATWDDDLVDGMKYVKFNYALLFSVPDRCVAFPEKKLCCLFAGNKFSSYRGELYSARRSLIRFFDKTAPYDFDLYGSGWGTSYSFYRGFVEDKCESMRRYKFAFVYENTENIAGYITEKIFDAFTAGCVPVYIGARNVRSYIPSDCFISGEEFEDPCLLYDFLRSMSEERYQTYLNAAARFLRSEQAKLFSRKKFIETFLQILESESRNARY